MATINVTITEAHDVSIEGLGRVTGTLEYEKGYEGSLEQPPDPPELGTIQLRDAFGIEIPDEIWDVGDSYYNLLSAVESLLPWNKKRDEIYDDASEVDYEIPF